MTPIYARYKDSNYLVSRFGTIRTADAFKLLKQERHYKGHMKISLSLKGKRKKFFVHRLVAEAFCRKPHRKDYNIVNHLDGIKDHNSWVNLEWTTLSGNTKHAVEMGLIDMERVRSFRTYVQSPSNLNKISPDN